jgi:dienelactone hydrolase
VLAWQANLSPCAEEVAIPSGEATLKALLFKPVGPGPIPAAVGLHASARWTVRPRAAVRDGTPGFRSAVARYPGCWRLHDLAWSARIPILIPIGAADDWSPAASARRWPGRRAAAAPMPSSSPMRVPTTNSTTPTGRSPNALGSRSRPTHPGAHAATHEGARADALRRVPEWVRAKPNAVSFVEAA